ncbi:MAG TPA: aminoglycoside adenylyltransferase domain-containing protein [Acidimicrobiales bacterium]|nr:aminoglycoside adenylyltransferase domain-containing protein [Acidimicrobiales bacterium]
MAPDLDPALDATVGRYLGLADRLLPGRVTGFYLIGSAALGAWRPGRSDVDGVAVVDRPLGGAGLRRLRAVHAAAGAGSTARALRRGHVTIPGTCNVAYVAADDLARPVTEIVPQASHVGMRFAAGWAFDVNPVQWKVLAESGIAVRGPAPASLGLRPEPDRLRDWNLANLDAYWRPWGEAAVRRPASPRWRPPRWAATWGTLGVCRLHCTVATGEVVSKEGAGEYARRAFGPEWHPIVDEALAYWRAEEAPAAFADRRARTRRAGEFVLEVVRDAHAL